LLQAVVVVGNQLLVVEELEDSEQRQVFRLPPQHLIQLPLALAVLAALTF
jgi:hypothetical protein